MVEYRVGDVIIQQTFGGGRRYVTVTDREEDVKNGRPGFDGVVASGPDKGTGVWGYDDQVVSVYAR